MFPKDTPIGKKLATVVIGLHLLIFVGAFAFSPKKPSFPPKIRVRTVVVENTVGSSPRQPARSSTSQQAPKASSKPPSPPRPKPASQKPKSSSSTKPIPPPKTKPKVTSPSLPSSDRKNSQIAPEKSAELIRSLKALEDAAIALEKDLLTETHRKPASPPLSDSIGTEENEYADRIVRYLQTRLQLPDSGEVRIAITLREDGTIANLQVLSAESEKNRKKLEECLPGLRFPPPPEKGSKSKSWIVTFYHDGGNR